MNKTKILDCINLRQVSVDGLIGQRLALTWRNNLLALDWEHDFLAPFREKKGNGGEYIGLGKTLAGLVRFAAQTFNPKLLELRKQVLKTLYAAQEPDGYLGTYQAPKRITPLWDVHEQAYILYALVADWQYFHEEQSLNAARKLGDHLVSAISAAPLTAIGNEVCLELSTLGLDRALLALYCATQDSRYLNFCLNILKLAEWHLPIVEGRHGKIEGHVYVYLTKCLAQLDLYELTGDACLLAQTRRALEYLRRKGGLVITGTCGQSECWHSDQTGTGDLGETCATAYLIRLLHRLLQLEGTRIHGDWMERTIYNALFAAQSPDGRMLRYYVPFDGKRTYWDKDTYCCPGNFRRIMAELPEMIYYKQQDGLLVNLYTSSHVTVTLANGLSLQVHQETDYPNSGQVMMRLMPNVPHKFTLRLRIPGWCRQFTASLNGTSIPPVAQRGFLCIEREWRKDDTIALNLEMPWRPIRGFHKQDGRVAMMHGPMLFCLNLARNPDLVHQDLKAITINPATIKANSTDKAIRPNGLACHLKASRNGSNNLNVTLTEFADPDGEATYFLCNEPNTAAADELLENA